MEGIPDTTFEVSNRMYQEIQELREREAQWKQERENFLQREKWWLHQWQQREMLFQARQLHLMNAQSQDLIETQKHADPLRHMYEQLLQDFKSYREEAKEREEVLVKLLQSDEHHLIVEIPPHSLFFVETKATQTSEVSEPEQPSFGSKAAQITEEDDHSVNTVISGDDDQILLTFGDIPKELQLWNDPSLTVVEMVPPKTPTTKVGVRKTKKTQSTQLAVEDVVQAKEKWFAEKWDEREKVWEKQCSELKSDHNNICNILKSLYERRIQELETAAQQSNRREEHLPKIQEACSAKPATSDVHLLRT